MAKNKTTEEQPGAEPTADQAASEVPNALQELPGASSTSSAEDRTPVPFKQVAAADVIASMVGINISQRSLPYPVAVGQVVYDPKLGHSAAAVVIDVDRLAHRQDKGGVVDVVDRGKVNLKALHGDVWALPTNSQIKAE